MTTKRFIAVLLMVLLGLSSSVVAATIGERVEMAHRRIEQGVRSGALTHGEAERLRREFMQVRIEEDRARADGHLDRRERERLSYELDRLEQHISHLKHNDMYRGDERDSHRHY